MIESLSLDQLSRRRKKKTINWSELEVKKTIKWSELDDPSIKEIKHQTKLDELLAVIGGGEKTPDSERPCQKHF